MPTADQIGILKTHFARKIKEAAAGPSGTYQLHTDLLDLVYGPNLFPDPSKEEERDAAYVIWKFDHCNTIYEETVTYREMRLYALACYKVIADHVPDSNAYHGKKVSKNQVTKRAKTSRTDYAFGQNFLGLIAYSCALGFSTIERCMDLSSVEHSEEAIYWCFVVPLALFMFNHMDPKLKAQKGGSYTWEGATTTELAEFVRNLIKRVKIGVWSPEWLAKAQDGVLHNDSCKGLDYTYCRLSMLIVSGFPTAQNIRDISNNPNYITEKQKEDLGKDLSEFVRSRFPKLALEGIAPLVKRKGSGKKRKRG
ncbi:unknown protein [Seminavis robusta]|uniref:Uncharacterized protein n=1 Tax=Seminavis robusta TaxID=568900 RepID=A0A9N8HW42_9STRA|nr:unknown protein [Seminavis robusta]|eukprot:Sro2519_g330100.1 n/a (309) ;mRNA; f:1808-2734